MRMAGQYEIRGDPGKSARPAGVVHHHQIEGAANAVWRVSQRSQTENVHVGSRHEETLVYQPCSTRSRKTLGKFKRTCSTRVVVVSRHTENRTLDSVQPGQRPFEILLAFDKIPVEAGKIG